MRPFILADLSFASEMCRAASEHHWVKEEIKQNKTQEQRFLEGLEDSVLGQVRGLSKDLSRQSVFQ